MFLDHLIDLGLDRREVERCRILHRRIVNRRQSQLSDFLLHEDKAPELTGVKVVHVAAGPVVRRLSANHRRPLERILTNVDHDGHVRSGLFAGPAPRLLIELELEVIEANRAQVRTSEVEQFVPFGWPFPLEQRDLVVAVQMILVEAVAKLHALSSWSVMSGFRRRP